MSESNLGDAVPQPLLIDAKQVAKLLGVSDKTVQRMRDAGKLPPPKRLGRLIRWRYDDIRRFVERL